MNNPRKALTIMEVMIAVALASFIAAIGFTGINAFGKAITRSKQFTSESQLIVAAMRHSMKASDLYGGNEVWPSAAIATPKNWMTAEVDAGNTLKFTQTVSNAQVGGKIEGFLKTNSSRENSLIIYAMLVYR